MKQQLLTVVIALCAVTTGCNSPRDAQGAATRSTTSAADSIRGDSIARARQDSINRAQPGYVIDSILPVDEELRRFRLAIGGSPVATLQHASESRDALVRRIVDDVARGDSADLRATLVTPREFADLIYPSSPYTREPYRQAPGLVWSRIDNPSQSGFVRLLRRRARGGLSLRGYSCDPKPDRQGENRLWTGCTLSLESSATGAATRQRWFGTIIERDGKFKVVSFTNQF